MLIVVALARTASALGRGQAGTSGAQFLKLAPGARPAAMGEAFTGVADDIHAVYYNPAGLGFLEEVQAGAMHHAHFQGINYEFGAVAAPVLSWTGSKEPKNARGVLAASVTNLSVDQIERRGTTETDAPIDTFGASDFAYGLAYGYAVSERLAVGAGAKFIDQTLDAAHATAVAADLGALYRGEGYSLGASVRHLGTRPKFSNESDPLPLTAALGGGYSPRKGWLMAADVRVPRDSGVGFSLGGEYAHRFSTDLSGMLRGGFNSSNRDPDGLTGISLGAGVAYGHFGFDFAWVPFGDLGNTFRYSLLVRF